MGGAHRRVGREEELAVVHRALADGRSVLVRGDDGIGKSCLVGESGEWLTLRGWSVERVVGAGPRAVPLAPFTHLLDLDDSPLPEPTELLARLRSRWRNRDDTDPSLLVVDDAHALDPASAQLVHQLGLVDGVTVLMAARARDGLPAPLLAWQRGPALQTLDLGPLSRPAAAALLGQLLPAPPTPETEERWWTLSGGTPLHLVELCRASLATGTLVDRDGQLHATDDPPASETLRAVVLARLSALDRHERDALDALALAGPLTVAIVSRLAGDEGLHRLEALGLVRVGTRPAGVGAQVDLANPLQRDIARDALTHGRARVVGVLLLAALEHTGAPTPADAVLAGKLRVELGMYAVPPLLLAADHALAADDPDLAIHLADAASTAGGGIAAEVRRAQALGLAGHVVEATALLEELTHRATEPDDVAEVALRRAVHLLSVDGDAAGANELLARHVTSTEHRDVDRVPLARRLRAMQATMAFFAGRPGHTVEIAAPLLAEPFEIDAAVPWLWAQAMLGRPEEMLPVLRRAGDAVGRGGSGPILPHLPLHLALVRQLCLWQLGCLSQAEVPIAEQGALPLHLAARRGHLDRAVDGSDDLGDRVPAILAPTTAYSSIVRAAVQAQRGETAAAEAALARVDQLPPTSRTGFSWWERWARLWLCAAQGDAGAAAHGFLDLADAHREESFHLTTGYEEVVRLGHPELVVDRLDAQAGRPGATWWDRICRDHAVASADRDAEALLGVSVRFEEGGLDLHALECAARAASWAPCRSVARAEARVAELHPRCGAVATPAMSSVASMLSPRERQVATLAAQGLTNRAIAERLGISPRTVGNQLYSVFQKLGIRSRDELRARRSG